MNSVYKGVNTPYPNVNPFGQNQQVVIPQITIPSGVQRFEPLTAPNKDAAYAMRTPPSTRVPIFDESESVFYFKETDASGNIVAFDVYDYTKREAPPPPEYVTVDKFEQFMNEFRSFKEDIIDGKQSVRAQAKQSYNGKQWNGSRSAERNESNKVPNADGAGEQ